MIFPSDIQLEVGKVYCPERMRVNGQWIEPQPLLVVRSATVDDFLSDPSTTDEDRSIGRAWLGYRYYFYEISSD